MTLQELLSYRNDILSVAAKYGAEKIMVFGSVARNEQNKSSDIDFLVQLQQGTSLLQRISLQLALEALLQQKVDVVSMKSVPPEKLELILNDAVPV